MEGYSSKEIKRFNHLVGEIDAVYHEIAMKMGLSDSASKILYTICENGEYCPLLDICRRSGVRTQTVNAAVRKLEAEGIVYLQPAGAKQKTVCLTKEGKKLAKRTAVRLIEAENDIFSSWDDGEVEQYLALTERFLSDIQKRADRIVGGRDEDSII